MCSSVTARADVKQGALCPSGGLQLRVDDRVTTFALAPAWRKEANTQVCLPGRRQEEPLCSHVAPEKEKRRETPAVCRPRRAGAVICTYLSKRRVSSRVECVSLSLTRRRGRTCDCKVGSSYTLRHVGTFFKLPRLSYRLSERTLSGHFIRHPLQVPAS